MYKQIATNKRNTIFILFGFIIFISLIGSCFAYFYNDWKIAIFTLIFSTAYAIFQFFISAKLAVLMTGAKPIEKKDNKRLYNTVENLCITTGLPMPKIYIIEDPAPNAFAAGLSPEKSIVAATTGLLNIMNDEELNAVMAHEISHIKNYDIRISMVTFALVSVVGFISDLGLRMLYFGRRSRDSEETSPVGILILFFVYLLAPIAAIVAQMAVSREREYLADSSAALITRYPEGMISALKKLQSHSQPMYRQNSATSALFINNPMKKGFWGDIFSTHPAIEKRIAKLEHGKKNF